MKCEEAVLVALMLLTSLTCSKCRYIDPPDPYQAERDYTVQDSSSAEDVDLEELMSNYYDQLMNELTTLEKEMEREMREVKLVEKQQDNVDQLMEVSLQLNQQSKYQFDDVHDYDYPADAPINPADQPKVLELSVVGVDYNGTQQQQQTPQMLNVTLDESERVKVQRESTADEEAIERSRELRLDSIRKTILSMRGGTSDVNTTVPSTRVLQEILEGKKMTPSNSSGNSYTEKLQSFYPSCMYQEVDAIPGEIPRHTDTEPWQDPVQMNLLFDVSYPQPMAGNVVTVHSARLRLYRLPYVNSTTSDGDSSGPDDDRLLRVSIYWYTRTLKKHRVKRKLLDSQMVRAGGRGGRGDSRQQPEWLELNVRHAVRTWKDLGRNYGMVVTVEDEDGQLLPATSFIRQMNCSKETATVKPIPSMVVDATHEYMREHPNVTRAVSQPLNGSAEVNPWQYPVYQFPQLDVSSVEVPMQEATEYQNRLKSDADIKATASMLSGNVRAGSAEAMSRMRGSSIQPPTDSGRVFSTVGVGVPSSGQNRNSLVPIKTKSDLVSSPEDGRQKKEMLLLEAGTRGRRHHKYSSAPSP